MDFTKVSQSIGIVPEEEEKRYASRNLDFSKVTSSLLNVPEEKEEERGFGGDLLHGLYQGADQTTSMLSATLMLAGGPDLSENIAEHNQNRSSPDYVQAYNQLLAENSKAISDNWNEGNYWKMLGSIGKTVYDLTADDKSLTYSIMEMLPNSLPTLGTGATVAGGTALLLGAAASAPVITTAFIVGSSIGTILTTIGEMSLDNVPEFGGDLTDAESIRKVFSNEEFQEKAAKEGWIKGGTIALVDALSFKLAGRLYSSSGKKLEKAIESELSELGVDVANRAAIREAYTNPKLKEKLSGHIDEYIKSTYKATDETVAGIKNAAEEFAKSQTFSSKLKTNVSALGIESGGEGLGEFTGEYAATGEAKPGEAIFEAVAGVGQSAITAGAAKALTGTGKASEVALKKIRQQQLDSVSKGEDSGLDPSDINEAQKDFNPVNEQILNTLNESLEGETAPTPNIASYEEVLGDSEARENLDQIVEGLLEESGYPEYSKTIRNTLNEVYGEEVAVYVPLTPEDQSLITPSEKPDLVEFEVEREKGQETEGDPTTEDVTFTGELKKQVDPDGTVAEYVEVEQGRGNVPEKIYLSVDGKPTRQAKNVRRVQTDAAPTTKSRLTGYAVGSVDKSGVDEKAGTQIVRISVPIGDVISRGNSSRGQLVVRVDNLKNADLKAKPVPKKSKNTVLETVQKREAQIAQEEGKELFETDFDEGAREVELEESKKTDPAKLKKAAVKQNAQKLSGLPDPEALVEGQYTKTEDGKRVTAISLGQVIKRKKVPTEKGRGEASGTIDTKKKDIREYRNALEKPDQIDAVNKVLKKRGAKLVKKNKELILTNNSGNKFGLGTIRVQDYTVDEYLDFAEEQLTEDAIDAQVASSRIKERKRLTQLVSREERRKIPVGRVATNVEVIEDKFVSRVDGVTEIDESGLEEYLERVTNTGEWKKSELNSLDREVNRIRSEVEVSKQNRDTSKPKSKTSIVTGTKPSKLAAGMGKVSRLKGKNLRKFHASATNILRKGAVDTLLGKISGVYSKSNKVGAVGGEEVTPANILTLSKSTDNDKIAKVYALASMLIYGQDSVTYSRPDSSLDIEDASLGGYLKSKKLLNDSQFGKLNKEVQRVVGADAKLIRINNFEFIIVDDSIGKSQLARRLGRLQAKFGNTYGFETEFFITKTETVSHDWVTDSLGEGIRDQIRELGFADLLEFIDNRRDAFLELAQQYGANIEETKQQGIDFAQPPATGPPSQQDTDVAESEIPERKIRASLSNARNTYLRLLAKAKESKRVRRSNAQVFELFDTIFSDTYGKPLNPIKNPDDYKLAVNILAAEIRYQIDQENSGLGWYTEDVSEAFKNTQQLIPELRTKTNQVMMTVITGVHSNGQKVKANWKSAATAIGEYFETGVIPYTSTNGKIIGVRGNTIVRQSRMLEELIKDKGSFRKALNWLFDVHTVKEIGEARAKYGNFANSNNYLPGGKDALYTGTFMFGPKVGAFIKNLNGINDDHSITIDVWATRTYNRIIGRASDNKGAPRGEPERDIIKRIFVDAGKRIKTPEGKSLSPDDTQALVWFFEQQLYNSLGTSAVPQGNTDGAIQFRKDVERGSINFRTEPRILSRNKTVYATALRKAKRKVRASLARGRRVDLSLTPAEYKFFSSVFNNSAELAELRDEAPSIEFLSNLESIRFDSSEAEALTSYIDSVVLLNEGERLPPRFYSQALQKEIVLSSSSSESVASSKDDRPTLYHVAFTEDVPAIKRQGILPFGGDKMRSNWVTQEGGDRLGDGGNIYAFSSLNDALLWASKMEWAFNKKFKTGNISIVSFVDDGKWDIDESGSPIDRLGYESDFLTKFGPVNAENILSSQKFVVKKPASEYRLGESKVRAALAYHGTGSRLEGNRFDLDYIGTGSGIQQFGWGIYFSQDKDVASHYSPRDPELEDLALDNYESAQRNDDWEFAAIWEDVLLHKDVNDLAQDYTKENGYEDSIIKKSKEVIKILKEFDSASNVYTVNIPDSKVENFLDWEAPLLPSDSLTIQLNKDFPTDPDITSNDLFQNPPFYGDIRPVGEDGGVKGAEIYRWLKEKLGTPQRASEYLLKNGISGLRYTNPSDETSNNFVIWDQDILDDALIDAPPDIKASLSLVQEPAFGGFFLDRVRNELNKNWGKENIENLEQQNILKIVSNDTELPAALRQFYATHEGIHDEESGISYLIAENIRENGASGVLMHEVGVHFGLKKMLGNRPFFDLLTDLLNRKDSAELKPYFDEVKDAYASVIDAGEMSEYDADFLEEVLAKIAQDPNASQMGIVEELYRRIRMFLSQYFDGITLKPEDLQAATRGALKKSMAGQFRPESLEGSKVLASLTDGDSGFKTMLYNILRRPDVGYRDFPVRPTRKVSRRHEQANFNHVLAEPHINKKAKKKVFEATKEIEKAFNAINTDKSLEIDFAVDDPAFSDSERVVRVRDKKAGTMIAFRFGFEPIDQTKGLMLGPVVDFHNMGVIGVRDEYTLSEMKKDFRKAITLLKQGKLKSHHSLSAWANYRMGPRPPANYFIRNLREGQTWEKFVNEQELTDKQTVSRIIMAEDMAIQNGYLPDGPVTPIKNRFGRYRYSLPSRSTNDLSAEAKAAIHKATGRSKPRGLFASLDDIRKNKKLWIGQGVADRYLAIKNTLGKDGEQAWMLMHLSDNATGLMHAVLNFGRPKEVIRNGQFDGYTVDENSKGLIEILEPLEGEIDNFLSWMVGHRADKLMKEGRENFYTKEDIINLKKLGKGKTDTGKSRTLLFAQTMKEISKFQSDILDLATTAGVISKEDRQSLLTEFYVPFYREFEKDGLKKVRGPAMNNDVVNLRTVIQKLKGSELKTNDVLHNLMMNWHSLLNAAMKNRAGVAAVEAAESAGVARKLDKKESSQILFSKTRSKTDKYEAHVYVMRDGKKEVYEINDHFVLTSLLQLNWSGPSGKFNQALSEFKRVLTITVTASPAFKIRNLMRDSLQSIAVGEMSYNVLGNVKEGASRASINDPTYRSLIASGGAFNFGFLHDDPSAVRRILKYANKNLPRTEKQLQERVLDTPGKALNFARKGWDAYGELGNRLENANRMSLYLQRVDEVGHLQASFEARDLLNFSAHGSWPIVNYLTNGIAFLNARIVGAHKLIRAGTAKETRARFLKVVGTITLASIAYELSMDDDEDYKALPDYMKEVYWPVKLPGGDSWFFIPKPFEIGAIASIAQRITEYFISESPDPLFVASRVRQILSDQMAFDWRFQAFKPALEIGFNYDSFRDQRIENEGWRVSGKLKHKMYRQNSTELSKAASRLMYNLSPTGEAPLSPVQIDHLMRGYLGWLGITVAGWADIVLTDGAPEPTSRLDDSTPNAKNLFGLAPISSFYKQMPMKGDANVNLFWEQFKDMQRLYQEYKSFADGDGTEQEYADWLADNGETFKWRSSYDDMRREMGDIGRMITSIYDSEEMTPDAKRKKIDELIELKNTSAKKLIDFRKNFEKDQKKSSMSIISDAEASGDEDYDVALLQSAIVKGQEKAELNDRLYESINAAEFRGLSRFGDDFIRTRVRPKGGSTAYGPLQITTGLMRSAKSQLNLNKPERQYVERFIDQGEKFIKYGNEPNRTGYEKRFDYGGSGELTSDLDKQLYKQVAKKLLELVWNQSDQDMKKFLNAWRYGGAKDVETSDKKYFSAFVKTFSN